MTFKVTGIKKIKICHHLIFENSVFISSKWHTKKVKWNTKKNVTNIQNCFLFENYDFRINKCFYDFKYTKLKYIYALMLTWLSFQIDSKYTNYKIL